MTLKLISSIAVLLLGLTTTGCAGLGKRPISFSYLDEGEIGDIRHRNEPTAKADAPEARIARKEILRNSPDLCEVRVFDKYKATDDYSADVDVLIRKVLRVQGDAKLSYQIESGKLEKWILYPNRIPDYIPAPISPDIAAYLITDEYEFATVDYSMRDLVVAIENRGKSAVTLEGNEGPFTLGGGEKRKIEVSEGHQVVYSRLPVISPARQRLKVIADTMAADSVFKKQMETWAGQLPTMLKQFADLGRVVHGVVRVTPEDMVFDHGNPGSEYIYAKCTIRFDPAFDAPPMVIAGVAGARPRSNNVEVKVLSVEKDRAQLGFFSHRPGSPIDAFYLVIPIQGSMTVVSTGGGDLNGVRVDGAGVQQRATAEAPARRAP